MAELSPEQKKARRDSHLKRTYGLNTEKYDQLLERQDNKCAVCLREADSFPVYLAVDHDHVTGEVRGLLCQYCNHRIVGRHRDPSLLRRVAEYLEVGTGWFVPAKKKRRTRMSRKKKVAIHGE